MNEELYCQECGVRLAGESVHIFEETVMCDHCFHRLTTVCDCCSERIWRSDAEGDSDTTLCTYCYENRYVTCGNCGGLVHLDDVHYVDCSDYPYCEDCYDNLQNRTIKEYHYKPEPIFYGSGNLFMGVELEIDDGGEVESYAEEIIGVAKNDHVYCKHDGSLNDGFELVSHPMTMEYHMQPKNIPQSEPVGGTLCHDFRNSKRNV